MNFSIRALGPTLVISDFLHEGACQIWWVGFRILCDVWIDQQVLNFRQVLLRLFDHQVYLYIIFHWIRNPISMKDREGYFCEGCMNGWTSEGMNIFFFLALFYFGGCAGFLLSSVLAWDSWCNCLETLGIIALTSRCNCLKPRVICLNFQAQLYIFSRDEWMDEYSFFSFILFWRVWLLSSCKCDCSESRSSNCYCLETLGVITWTSRLSCITSSTTW